MKGSKKKGKPAPRAGKLWGGRFKKELDPLLKCFSYSLAVDIELLESELRVDEAWTKMLARAGLVTAQESRAILSGLKAVRKELVAGRDPHAPLDPELAKTYEDVHTLVQAKLEEHAGEAARKLHTGRSRNDLVVTSTRLYLMDKLSGIGRSLTAAQKGLVSAAKKAGGLVLAGMTHLKKAQPVLAAHHLLAYVEMLEEDRERLEDAAKRVSRLPLGSAALAGSALPIDRDFLAAELGFSGLLANSLAAVSDRAFLTECAAALAILWMHLSRLSEDMILWNSEPFGYIELDDAFATGSSLMPQKKNPDLFELVRARSAVIFGHVQALLALQKGLPLAYNRDLQEDKPALFDTLGKTGIALELIGRALVSVKFHAEACRASVQDETLFAADLLEYLVRKNVAFSEAHALVGRMVRRALETGRPLGRWPLSEWKSFSHAFEKDVFALLDAGASVRGKKTAGSTHPDLVKAELRRWQAELARRSPRP